MVNLLACGLSTATNSAPESIAGIARAIEHLVELGFEHGLQELPPKPQDALEMSKQHLDGLAMTARSLESLSLSQP
jgi:hypothetical protein